MSLSTSLPVEGGGLGENVNIPILVECEIIPAQNLVLLVMWQIML